MKFPSEKTGYWGELLAQFACFYLNIIFVFILIRK